MGSCIRLRNSILTACSCLNIRFLIVLRPITNEPHLHDRVQKCVKPRKSKGSGFPSPSSSRCLVVDVFCESRAALATRRGRGRSTPESSPHGRRSGRSRFTLRSLKPAYPSHSRLISTLSLALLRQILVEECRQLAEVLLRLGRIGIARILRMRLAFEHVEIRDDAGLAQLAMHTYRVGQEQVTRARRENGRRKTGEVPIHRRKLRILQVMTVGIELRGIA